MNLRVSDSRDENTQWVLIGEHRDASREEEAVWVDQWLATAARDAFVELKGRWPKCPTCGNDVRRAVFPPKPYAATTLEPEPAKCSPDCGWVGEALFF
jgi:hypothetical protein